MRSPISPLLRTVLYLSLVGFALVTLTGCGDKTITIGVIVPSTGVYESYGEPVRKGIELALDEIRADPNYTLALELQVADSESSPDKAAELLQGMFRDNVPLVIGGVTSGEAISMTTNLDRSNKILLSPTASSPDLTGVSSNFFRIHPSDFLEASRMALFARQTRNLEEIAILAEGLGYAKGIQAVFSQEFERLGGTIVGTEEYPANTSDFSGLAEWATGLNPPAIYLAGYDAGLSAAIPALRKAGYQGDIMTTAAFATASAIADAGDAAVGVLLTKVVFEADSEHAHIKTFVNGYQEKFGETPDLFAAHGYDAMKLVAKALEGRTLVTSEIIKGLRALNDFPGVTGSIQFDERGDVKKFPRVYLVSKDLTLYNYDNHAAEEREKLEARRKALEEKMRKLRDEAQDLGN